MSTGSAARALRRIRFALAAVALAGCAGVASGRAEEPPTIAVNGTGRVSVRPDVALLSVGAEARAATLAEATAETARRMTAVVGRLKALGIADADIATVAYAIEPIPAPRRTEDEGTRIVAYRAVNVARVKLRALDRAGQALDEAVAAGANVVRGVQFTLADFGPAEARARADAVRDATTRARELAAAAGVRLGALAWLNEGAASRPVPVMRTAVAMAPGGLEAGELEVTVTVEARWRILP